MSCIAETKEIEEIKPTNILPQTRFWARVKNSQGFIPSGFEITVSKDLLLPFNKKHEKITDDLLVLIKYFNSNQCFAYVPYGPKVEPDFENHGVFLEELSEVLRPLLPANCVFLRYDLMWKNQWAQEDDYFDSAGNWLGPPASSTQEFRVNFNTNQWNLKKSPGDFLPKNTFFIDLSVSEDELLYNMRNNTRHNIRRALRNGVQVQEYGIDALDEWYEMYTETAKRKNMVLQDKDYFTTILRKQGRGRKDVKVSLLMADFDGIHLSSMFLVLSNNRGTYLFGASSENKRQLMASYALQWEAIRKAKMHGCFEYDMFGCAPNLNEAHPLHGVHLFKKGFGGKLYHRMGCWDYPFMHEDYELIKAIEMHD